MNSVKEKAIELAIQAMKPLLVSTCGCGYTPGEEKTAQERHEESMRFCKEYNSLQAEMLISLASKIENYLSVE